jgi:hypothetical protein
VSDADADADAEVGAEADAPLAVLLRWEGSGGVWRVVRHDPSGLEIVLLTCSANEEMGRILSADPELLEHVGSRTSSEA